MSIVTDTFAALPKADRLQIAAVVRDAEYAAHESTREVEVYGMLRNQSVPHGENTESAGTRSVGHKVLIREVDSSIPLTDQFAGSAFIFDERLRRVYDVWFAENSEMGTKTFTVDARPKTNSPAYCLHRSDPYYRNQDGFLVPVLNVEEVLEEVTADDWAGIMATAKEELAEGNFGTADDSAESAESADPLDELL